MKRLVAYLVITIVVILLFGMAAPFIVDRVISREDAARSIAEPLIRNVLPNSYIKIENASVKKRVPGYYLEVHLRGVALFNENISFNASSIILSIPFPQLLMGTFRPAHIDIRDIFIKHQSDNKQFQIESASSSLSVLIGIMPHLAKMPKINIKGVTWTYGDNIFTLNRQIHISHTMTNQALSITDNSGTIKVAMHKVGSSHEIMAEIKMLAINSSALQGFDVNLIGSGIVNVMIDAHNKPISAEAKINKLKGTVARSGNVMIVDNTLLDATFSDGNINIKNASSTVNGNKVQGSGIFGLTPEQPGLQYADFSLRDSSILPIYILKHALSSFNPEAAVRIADTGCVTRMGGLYENGKISRLDIAFSELGIIDADTPIKDISGIINVRDGKLAGHIDKAIIGNNINAQSIYMSGQNYGEHWEFDISGQFTTPSAFLLDYIRTSGKATEYIDSLAIDRLSIDNFENEEVIASFKINTSISAMNFSRPKTDVWVSDISLSELQLGRHIIPYARASFSIINNVVTVKIENLNGAIEDDIDIRIEKNTYDLALPADVLRALLPERPVRVLEDNSDLIGRIVINAQYDASSNSVYSSVNLINATLDIPFIKLKKPRGQSATLLFSMRTDTAHYELRNLSLKTNNKLLNFHKAEIYESSMQIDSLTIDSTSEASILISWTNDIPNSTENITIEIKSHNFIYDKVDISQIGRRQNEQQPNINFDIKAKRVLMHNNIILEKCRMYGSYRGNAGIAMEIGGYLGNNGDFFYLSQKSSSWRLAASNAGQMLAAFNVTQSLSGGVLRLEANILEGITHNTAYIHNFSITKTPLVARLLSFTSLTGLLDTLDGSGIKFDKLVAQFTQQDDTINITSAFADGGSLGFQIKGAVTPTQINVAGVLSTMQMVNRALQFIPLYSDLIMGGAGGGFLGICFTMRGDINDPAILVNPLSIFTPGIMKRLFERRDYTIN